MTGQPGALTRGALALLLGLADPGPTDLHRTIAAYSVTEQTIARLNE